MRLLALPLLLSLFSLFVPSISAISANEAFQIDYHHALLGTPQRHSTLFHQPSAASKASLLYTLSESNVVGAVNPKDGTLVWRQYLWSDARNETERKGFLKAGNGENTVVTAIGSHVRAWDAADGRLVWAWEGSGIVRSLEIMDFAGQSKDVLVLHDDKGKAVITRLEATAGKLVWQQTGDR